MKPITMHDIMEYLVVNSPDNLPPKALAGAFDQLVWCQTDNGKALSEVREVWLQGDDFQRVAIALAMNEIYPFMDESKMVYVLDGIAKRWPSLSERCNELITSRRGTRVDSPVE
jgi:hypothetical protein